MTQRYRRHSLTSARLVDYCNPKIHHYYSTHRILKKPFFSHHVLNALTMHDTMLFGRRRVGYRFASTLAAIDDGTKQESFQTSIIIINVLPMSILEWTTFFECVHAVGHAGKGFDMSCWWEIHHGESVCLPWPWYDGYGGITFLGVREQAITSAPRV